MKKTLLVCLMCLVAVFGLVLSACTPTEEHTHTFDETKWEHDADNHWHKATCEHTDEVKDKAAHTFEWKSDDTKHWQECVCGEKKGEADHTYDEKGECVCGKKQHVHSYSQDWKFDENKHWHECECGDKKDEADHNYGEDGKCEVCGRDKSEDEHTHTFDEEWKYDDTKHWHDSNCGHDVKGSEGEHKWDTAWKVSDTKHWHECTICHKTKDEADHVFKEGVCECGKKDETNVHTHTFDEDVWKSDENTHWHPATCDHENEKGSEAKHTPDDDYSYGLSKHWKECTECGYHIDEEDHTFVNGVCECGRDEPKVNIMKEVLGTYENQDAGTLVVDEAKITHTKGETVTVWVIIKFEYNSQFTLEADDENGELITATAEYSTYKKTITLKAGTETTGTVYTKKVEPSEVDIPGDLEGNVFVKDGNAWVVADGKAYYVQSSDKKVDIYNIVSYTSNHLEISRTANNTLTYSSTAGTLTDAGTAYTKTKVPSDLAGTYDLGSDKGALIIKRINVTINVDKMEYYTLMYWGDTNLLFLKDGETTLTEGTWDKTGKKITIDSKEFVRDEEASKVLPMTEEEVPEELKGTYKSGNNTVVIEGNKITVTKNTTSGTTEEKYTIYEIRESSATQKIVVAIKEGADEESEFTWTESSERLKLPNSNTLYSKYYEDLEAKNLPDNVQGFYLNRTAKGAFILRENTMIKFSSTTTTTYNVVGYEEDTGKITYQQSGKKPESLTYNKDSKTITYAENEYTFTQNDELPDEFEGKYINKGNLTGRYLNIVKNDTTGLYTIYYGTGNLSSSTGKPATVYGTYYVWAYDNSTKKLIAFETSAIYDIDYDDSTKTLSNLMGSSFQKEGFESGGGQGGEQGGDVTLPENLAGNYSYSTYFLEVSGTTMKVYNYGQVIATYTIIGYADDILTIRRDGSSETETATFYNKVGNEKITMNNPNGSGTITFMK